MLCTPKLRTCISVERGPKCCLIGALLCLFCSCQKPIPPPDPFAKMEGLYGLMVLQNERVLVQNYYHDKGETDLFFVQSVTKSIMALLIGIAIEKGLVKSVDEPIVNYFPEIKNDPDPRKSQVRIRDIMNQKSGLQDFEYPRLGEWKRHENPTQLVLQAPMASNPGEINRYNTAATHLLSAILSRASGMSSADFADRYLFGPLGITRYRWGKFKDGYCDGGGMSLQMRTEDLLKIGQVLLANGRWKGRQLIAKSWLDEVLRPKVPGNAYHGYAFYYNLCWYSDEFRGHRIYSAMGYGGQYLLLIPDLKAVIAANHAHDTPNAGAQMSRFYPKVLELIVEKLELGK
jgi:CubicO group peptidase (beta-lactamase class C family)